MDESKKFPSSADWQNLISSKKVGFIFDLDGTIVDTQADFHAAAECEMLRRYCGKDVAPEEISSRFAGIPTAKVFEELVPGCDAKDLTEKKWDCMHKIAGKRSIDCLPGMYDFIFFLSKSHIPIAIGSASPLSWISTCLKEALNNGQESHLDNFFKNCYVSAEECENPKPAPDLFLLARERMLSGNIENKDEFKIFVVGDGRADVLAGLAMDAYVLYLSPTDTEFDSNPKVKRFASTKELSEYIIKPLF